MVPPPRAYRLIHEATLSLPSPYLVEELCAFHPPP
jgi:hypothetical protein